MKLSILIPTCKENKKSLDQLFATLLPQIKELEGEIEIFLEADPKMQIGAKMNSILKDAVGRYVWFLNDTDLVSETSIHDIFKAIDSEPDIIKIHGANRVVDKVTDWKSGINNPCFNSPMKIEHARLYPFRKKSIKAVESWLREFERMSPFVTEAEIEKPIIRKNIGLTVIK